MSRILQQARPQLFERARAQRSGDDVLDLLEQVNDVFHVADDRQHHVDQQRGDDGPWVGFELVPFLAHHLQRRRGRSRSTWRDLLRLRRGASAQADR